MLSDRTIEEFLNKNLYSKELQTRLVEFTFDTEFIYLIKNDKVYYFDYNSKEDIKELLDFIKTMKD